MLVVASTSAHAVAVEVLAGNVSVNHGKGYQKIAGIFEAAPGDRILVEAGSAANIVYSDGCTVKLGDPARRAVFLVSPQAPCPAGLQPSTAVVTGVVVGAAIIGGVIIAADSGSNKPASP